MQSEQHSSDDLNQHSATIVPPPIAINANQELDHGVAHHLESDLYTELEKVAILSEN